MAGKSSSVTDMYEGVTSSRFKAEVSSLFSVSSGKISIITFKHIVIQVV